MSSNHSGDDPNNPQPSDGAEGKSNEVRKAVKVGAIRVLFTLIVLSLNHIL